MKSRRYRQVAIMGANLQEYAPHCGKEKPLSEFGFRNMGNGEIRNQSWCKECRSKG